MCVCVCVCVCMYVCVCLRVRVILSAFVGIEVYPRGAVDRYFTPSVFLHMYEIQCNHDVLCHDVLLVWEFNLSIFAGIASAQWQCCCQRGSLIEDELCPAFARCVYSVCDGCSAVPVNGNLQENLQAKKLQNLCLNLGFWSSFSQTITLIIFCLNVKKDKKLAGWHQKCK